MKEDFTKPGDYIERHLLERNWKKSYLADIMGVTTSRVSELISGDKKIDVEMAKILGAIFDESPMVWLNREQEYQLQKENQEADRKAQRSFERAKVYRRFPMKELFARGWINASAIESVESQVKRLYRIENIDDNPSIPVAMRQSMPSHSINPLQAAWVCRTLDIAESMTVNEFDHGKMPAAIDYFRKLAAFTIGASKVPEAMSHFGIRFVINEPIPGSKIDGAAMWIKPNMPVIGMTLRFDRLDYFWFTLMHELSHILHRDASIDSATTFEDVEPVEVSDIENRANRDAGEWLVDQFALKEFIRRNHPKYSIGAINQFCNQNKILPAIVIGQLQHLGEIDYGRFKKEIGSVRSMIVPASTVDGWSNYLLSKKPKRGE